MVVLCHDLLIFALNILKCRYVWTLHQVWRIPFLLGLISLCNLPMKFHTMEYIMIHPKRLHSFLSAAANSLVYGLVFGSAFKGMWWSGESYVTWTLQICCCTHVGFSKKCTTAENLTCTCLHFCRVQGPINIGWIALPHGSRGGRYLQFESLCQLLSKRIFSCLTMKKN